MSDDATNSRMAGSGQNNSSQTGFESIELDELPTVIVQINSLLLDDSPRRNGESDKHVRVLAEAEEKLPPIIVHAQSMRVIDGTHRVRAAIMRGVEEIEARIYHGSCADAFVLAVRMNTAHGLPLTRADRTTAAVRIIESHPQWSNRMVAAATGLSAGTVGKVRRRSTAQNAQSNTRVGKDGRARPINAVAARLKAAKLLSENPTASIRTTAKDTGLSPSTVHDVRQRLREGRDPAPEQRTPEICSQRFPGVPGALGNVDLTAILAELKRDPALRFSARGKHLIQYLDRYRLSLVGSNKFADMVPDHCAETVARLARGYALAWTKIAVQLETRRFRGAP
jgi:transposase-like protein